MPIFIIYCLLLSFLVHSQSSYLPLLVTPVAVNVGWVLVGFCLLAGLFKKLPSSVWHDGFAVGTLLVWYGDWQPLFDGDAPMFRIFPVYYAILSLWLTLAFINRSAQFDAETRYTLRYLQRLIRFDTRMMAGLLIFSLLFPEQYLLYPIAMTLFMVRFTMQRCLEIIGNGD
jgi:hypothetical protein